MTNTSDRSHLIRLTSALRALLAEAESLHVAYNEARERDGWDAFEEDESIIDARAALDESDRILGKPY